MEGNSAPEDTVSGDTQVTDIHVKLDPAAVDWQNAVGRSCAYESRPMQYRPCLQGRPMNEGSGNLTRPCCIVCDCHASVAHDHAYACKKCSVTDGHSGTMNNGSTHEVADTRQKRRDIDNCTVENTSASKAARIQMHGVDGSESPQSKTRRLARERQRRRRRTETPRERDDRRQAMAERDSARRDRETDEERILRLKTIAQRDTERRPRETDEARAKRKQSTSKRNARHRTEETDQERQTRLQTMSKRKCVRQVHESDHKCCTRLEQNAMHQATARTSETHEQTRERRERDARCHPESRCGTATTKEQTTEGLDHNGNAAGSESHPANEPEWRRWHTDAFKQKVRDNLNRFHQSMSSLQFATCELCHEA